MATAQTIINLAACPVLESVPEKMDGAWVFKGTRVPVSVVLSNISEMTVAEIVADFPS